MEKIKLNSLLLPEDLPDNGWEKQYKEDCEFIRKISEDSKDYGEFFLPKIVYVPTEMPQYMKEIEQDFKDGNLNTKLFKDDLNARLDNIQMGINKILLQSVYNNYLHLIESAKSRKDEESEKEYTKKAEEVLKKIKSLEEGEIK